MTNKPTILLAIASFLLAENTRADDFPWSPEHQGHPVLSQAEVTADKNAAIGGANVYTLPISNQAKDLKGDAHKFGYPSKTPNETKEFRTDLDLIGQPSVHLAVLADDAASIDIYGLTDKKPLHSFGVSGGAVWNPASFKEDSFILESGKKYTLALHYKNIIHWTDDVAGLVDVDGVSVYRVKQPPVQLAFIRQGEEPVDAERAPNINERKNQVTQGGQGRGHLGDKYRNVRFPLTAEGNNGCHCVSNLLTSGVYLGGTNFDGSVNSNGNPIRFTDQTLDPDTFRVELEGLKLAAGQTATIKVEVVRDGQAVASQTSDLILGMVTIPGSVPTRQVQRYRTKKYFRLVADAVDQKNNPANALLAKLGDEVRASLEVKNDQRQVVPISFVPGNHPSAFPVARPASEDGFNAVRTVHQHWVAMVANPDAETTEGQANAAARLAAINKAMERSDEVWAQAAVQFRNDPVGAVANAPTVDVRAWPSSQVLALSGAATAAGRLAFDMTRPPTAPGAQPDSKISSLNIAKGDTAAVVAGKIKQLATGFGMAPVVTNSPYRSAGVTSMASLIVFEQGQPNGVKMKMRSFVGGDNLTVQPGQATLKEVEVHDLAILSVFFKDTDAKTLDVFSIPTPKMDILESGALGVAVATWNTADTYSLQQRQPLIAKDSVFIKTSALPHAYVLAHEIGHVLTNGDHVAGDVENNRPVDRSGNDIPAALAIINLMKAAGSKPATGASNTVDGPKRLTHDQCLHVRSAAGSPHLLHKD